MIQILARSMTIATRQADMTHGTRSRWRGPARDWAALEPDGLRRRADKDQDND